MHLKGSVSIAKVAMVVCIISVGSASECYAQSVLNQSSDELLKGFDVDPSVLNQQYQSKPAIDAKGMVMKFIGAIIPDIDIGTTPGDRSISVKAPFVNVSVNGSQKNVRVSVPFVKVDTSSGISVKAPKLNFSLPPQPQSSQPQSSPQPQSSTPPQPGASQGSLQPESSCNSQSQSQSSATQSSQSSQSSKSAQLENKSSEKQAIPELRPPID